MTLLEMLIPSQVEVDPQAIPQLAASNTGYQTYNPYKSADPDLKVTSFGPASGVGSGFHFDGKNGNIGKTFKAGLFNLAETAA